jgi:hypothetical protein
LARTHCPPGSQIPMPNMSAEDLAEHIKILDSATTAELDELLEDLLVRAYPTKTNQDS